MISTNNIKDSPISIGGEMTTKDWKGVFFVQQDQQHISPRNGGEKRDRGGGRQRRTSGADPCGISVLGGPGGRRPGADGDQESWTLPAAKEDHGQSVSGRFQKGRNRI